MLLFRLLILLVALSLIGVVIKNTIGIIGRLILIGFALFMLSLLF